MRLVTGALPGCALLLITSLSPTWGANDLSTPEAVLRALVRANAEQDLAAMSALMAHDPDSIGYSIGGRKYVGWEPFAQEMRQEFEDVEQLEIPITDLQVWTRGNVAWFAMELDYVRYVKTTSGLDRVVLPLRETGVLERRDSQWVVVSWHESKRRPARGLPAPTAARSAPVTFDLSGDWLIEEEDKTYRASLDARGNGTYTHQGGTFKTVTFEGRRLTGTWHQTGNDREGGFEVLFSEDGNEARGVWWYSRVGSRTNIPPRLHGGTYVWTRVDSSRSNHQAQ